MALLVAGCAHAGDDVLGTGGDAGDPGDGATAADGGASGIVWIGPEPLLVPRGATATLTINLDHAAGPGGALLSVTSDDPGSHLSHAGSVMIPEGETSGQVVFSGLTLGGPIPVTVGFGESTKATMARVVPPLDSLVPARSEVFAGGTVDVAVALEQADDADVLVSLTSSNPAIATVSATTMIRAGETTATITVSGEDLGGMVTIEAGIGDARLSMPLRVGGLYLSEILYDVAGADDQREWIELYNAGAKELSLAGVKLQSNNGTQGFVDVLQLSGTLSPGACAVVGGPLSGSAAANFTPEGFAYSVNRDFATDLGNAGDPDDTPPAPADAIQLVMASGAVIDNVLYGRNNSGSMTDENGAVPGSADAIDVEPGRSLERTAAGVVGPWQAQLTPNPGDCAAIAP